MLRPVVMLLSMLGNVALMVALAMAVHRAEEWQKVAREAQVLSARWQATTTDAVRTLTLATEQLKRCEARR